MTEQGRQRRSLSHQGGDVRTAGDPRRAEALRAVLASAGTVDPDELTHGFHPYPARMHPGVARGVLEGVAAAEGVAAGPILDPFCGGGTVLVEALRAGRGAIGVDLHPLALWIAEARTRLRSPDERRRLEEAAEAVAAASEARVRARVPAMAPIPRALVPRWDPHVLKELAGLREEILAVPELPREDRRALLVVLSSLVGKFSRKRADTSEQEVPKRIRKGLPTEFFLRKTRELVARWAALGDAVPSPPPPLALRIGDARGLPEVLAPVRAPQPTLVVTSPPYGGTYDYASHHALRTPWLGLDDRALQRGEIGARRNLSRGVDGVRRWNRELGAAIRSMAAVLHPRGRLVLWIGDGRVGGRDVPADQQVGELAGAAGLSLVAGASQPRPDWADGRPRREHLLLLEPRR